MTNWFWRCRLGKKKWWMISELAVKWHMCLHISRDHISVTIWWKQWERELERRLARKCVSVQKLVYVINDEIAPRLPLGKVIVQHLKCKPSWICVWIVNILYAGGETSLFTLLSKFPRQNRWSWCEAETQQVVIAWAGFRKFVLQMNCQYIEETSKDSTLVYWWVQRGKTKTVYRGLCFWQWFFVLDSLVGVLWWLINPLG